MIIFVELKGEVVLKSQVRRQLVRGHFSFDLNTWVSTVHPLRKRDMEAINRGLPVSSLLERRSLYRWNRLSTSSSVANCVKVSLLILRRPVDFVRLG